jgi:RecQ family ATP-dependent DNA helicase
MPEHSDALRRHFDHPAFRPGQMEAVAAAIEGRDVLLVMPTGAGKSLCYQLPALEDDERLTVVVSPLVSLMQDQVDGLADRAELVNAQRDAAANAESVRRALAGEVRLLYVAPERFWTPGFGERLKGRVGMFVVDEAHCVSQWGHDFRPEYFRLGEIARRLGASSIFAATATATPRVAVDIIRRLGLRDPVRIATGFERPNLSYDVVQPRGERARDAALLGLLREPGALPAIVYSGTRKRTEATATRLARELGEPVPAYHAGMERRPRAEAQRAFMAGEAPVVVATNAFGMGVDKANVRTVVHEAVPSSLEAYYQEAGRGGRDGMPSRCVLLVNPQDKGLHVFFINQTEGEDAKRQRWAQYRAIWGYVDGEGCRRAAILRHFGDRTGPHAEGRCCDVCDGPLAVDSASSHLAAVTSQPGPSNRLGDDADVRDAIAAVVEAASPPVGRTRAVEILRGGRSKVVLKYGYDELPGYGNWDDWRADELLAEVDAMIEAGRLSSTGGRFPKLAASEAAA